MTASDPSSGGLTEAADLAELLRDWRLTGCKHDGTTVAFSPFSWPLTCSPCLRDRILASDWLADHDAAARRDALLEALHDVWLRVHNCRFSEVQPDSTYNGIRLAEHEIGAVAAEHGIDYHALRAALDPVTPTETGEGT